MSSFDTAEFQRNPGLAGVNVLPAYDDGLSGAGITVAVVDTGIDTKHLDLIDNVDPRSTNISTGFDSERDDIDGHGTEVAGILAAMKNDSDTHGVAFNAKILSLRADDPGSCDAGDCQFFDHVIADAVDFAISRNVRIINISLGSNDGNVSSSLVSALQRAAAAGAIIVISAGNESVAAINNGVASVAADPLVAGHIIVAGALDSTNDLAGFSNIAGNGLKDFFLTAPGSRLRSTGLNDTQVLVSGTSFSAPLISGAAALLWEKFPELTAAQVIDILYTSAVDLGAAGVDGIFGHGGLDIGAAIAPIGTTSVPQGVTVTGPGADVTTTGISLGAPFGDALSGDNSLARAIVLDSFDRAYRYDLRDLIARPVAVPDLLGRTHDAVRRVTHARRISARQSLSISFTDEQSPSDMERRFDLRDRLGPRYRNKAFSFTSAVGSHSSVTVSSGTGFTGASRFPGQMEGGTLLSRGADRSPFATLAEQDSAVAVTHRLDSRTELRFATALGEPYRRDRAEPRQRSFANVLGIERLFRSGGGLSVEVGTIHEQGRFLASRASGAFDGLDGATTVYTTLAGSLPLGRTWSLAGRLSRGFSQIGDGGSRLLHDFSTVRAGAFSVAAIGRDLFQPGDRLSMTLSQPLRVGHADAILDIATGRAFGSDALIRESGRVNLTPSGRELDFEASYRLAGGSGGALQTNLLYQTDPGHVSGAAGVLSLLLEFSKRF